jgi:hypothetical protein
MLSILNRNDTQELPMSPGLMLLCLMSACVLLGASVVGIAHRLRGDRHSDLSIDVLIALSALGGVLVHYRNLRAVLRPVGKQRDPASD